MNNPQAIRSILEHNEKLWNSSVRRPIYASQSEWFEKHIPKDDSDFTDIFVSEGFEDIFTAKKTVDDQEVSKIITTQGFNCNFLYRQCMKMPDILIAANDDFIALHPLGEPGRDLDDIEMRISHFMVVSRKNIVLNHALPLTADEKLFLKKKCEFIDDVYNMLFDNSSLADCGYIDKSNLGYMKVIEMQMEHSMGISLYMRIRDFIALQIQNLSETIKNGTPGYTLMYKGVDVKDDSYDNLLCMLNEVFDKKKVYIYKCIQGPDNCSQLYSHIHTFLVPHDRTPTTIIKNYLCIDTIIKMS